MNKIISFFCLLNVLFKNILTTDDQQEAQEVVNAVKTSYAPIDENLL